MNRVADLGLKVVRLSPPLKPDHIDQVFLLYMVLAVNHIILSLLRAHGIVKLAIFAKNAHMWH